MEVQEKNNIDKSVELTYNGNNDIDNKDMLIMNNSKSQNNYTIKVTTSFLVDKPTKMDIVQLQKEIQYILLSNVHQYTLKNYT